MKYIAVLFWSILLLEMVGFVLSSLNGEASSDLVFPIIIAVIFTIFVALFDLVIGSNHDSTKEEL
ncbi:YjzD family protein [Staphylococcus sp. SQ8-PEA]|uniref:YjzD family protein n=1 Tax=Staphylococcus marylandisciuri TaxID=2981529 RepID=A0ABT2QPS6_9STAP|nr:YjzD family protein [Staphylococcus marylandisciuri]MCU5745978.1 YjzD family protein [Staphylococcus marylandisciuri]